MTVEFIAVVAVPRAERDQCDPARRGDGEERSAGEAHAQILDAKRPAVMPPAAPVAG
jgi:hypothetical protein